MSNAPVPKPPKPQDFLSYVSDYDITEQQKIEFLTCLFEIMRGFVDLGFGINCAPGAQGEVSDRLRLDDTKQQKDDIERDKKGCTK